MNDIQMLRMSIYCPHDIQFSFQEFSSSIIDSLDFINERPVLFQFSSEICGNLFRLELPLLNDNMFESHSFRN